MLRADSLALELWRCALVAGIASRRHDVRLRSRPACGKVCKLVCETKKLTAVGYGCECKDDLHSGPKPARLQTLRHDVLRRGDDLKGCRAQDASSAGTTGLPAVVRKPRTVKVLTKYQAEKKICWYHWEVVDAACCDCVSKDGRNAAECSQSRYLQTGPGGRRVGRCACRVRRGMGRSWPPSLKPTEAADCRAGRGISPTADAGDRPPLVSRRNAASRSESPSRNGSSRSLLRK